MALTLWIHANTFAIFQKNFKITTNLKFKNQALFKKKNQNHDQKRNSQTRTNFPSPEPRSLHSRHGVPPPPTHPHPPPPPHSMGARGLRPERGLVRLCPPRDGHTRSRRHSQTFATTCNNRQDCQLQRWRLVLKTERESLSFALLHFCSEASLRSAFRILRGLFCNDRLIFYLFW